MTLREQEPGGGGVRGNRQVCNRGTAGLAGRGGDGVSAAVNIQKFEPRHPFLGGKGLGSLGACKGRCRSCNKRHVQMRMRPAGATEVGPQCIERIRVTDAPAHVEACVNTALHSGLGLGAGARRGGAGGVRLYRNRSKHAVPNTAEGLPSRPSQCTGRHCLTFQQKRLGFLDRGRQKGGVASCIGARALYGRGGPHSGGRPAWVSEVGSQTASQAILGLTAKATRRPRSLDLAPPHLVGGLSKRVRAALCWPPSGPPPAPA